MPKPTSAEEILPLVAALSPRERIRLIRLLAQQPKGGEAVLYAAAPLHPNEFSSDEDSLDWDAEGWEETD